MAPSTNNGAPAPTSTSDVGHVELRRHDLTYDHRAAQAALPVTVRYRDGALADTLLVPDPDQMMVLLFQLERAVEKRRTLPAAEEGR
ncbi:hypothetical protein [Streptomyces luteireticuli]|uniref:Uncharacterized protein n=1 Tax=Streptomyces luteireticuli TaxID=173858 RepID=A0ABP3IUY5_9ACTN